MAEVELSARHCLRSQPEAGRPGELLKPFSREGNEVRLTGANLHIVNGLRDTTTTNRPVGNLIVGYNEPRVGEAVENIRTGSHNVVEGKHNFSASGASWSALQHDQRQLRPVNGGSNNTASSFAASVSGGDEQFEPAAISRRSAAGAKNTASGAKPW